MAGAPPGAYTAHGLEILTGRLTLAWSYLTVPNILIVEDMPVLRDLLCELLAGYVCHAVRTAEEGLALLARVPFDLVITDVGLPGMSGDELLRTLRAVRPRTPVIVITGGDPALREVDFMNLGASAYLQKPFTVAELERAIEQALGRGAGTSDDRGS